MTFETLRHNLDDGILTVTLNRPDELNAFTVTMADELERTFREVNDDDRVRAIIVTGEGRAFCAGMDLSVGGNVFGLDESRQPSLADMTDLDDPRLERVRDTGGRVTLAIHDCRKPVIAAINGPAVGIGATMTLAMDRRIMSEKARFGLVFGRIGIVPEAASTWFLERLVGPASAIDLLLRADILTADSAVSIGLAEDVVPESADAWTKDRSPVAVAFARQMVRRNGALAHPVDAHRIDSLAMFYTSIGDGKEGVASFLEKRKPNFQGKASQMPRFYDEWIEQTD
jgi:enoyl-CoA hydratase/carnithine racemase